MANNWSGYEKPSEKEVEYALDTVDKLTTPEEEGEIRLTRGGRKRWESGSSKRPPLTGCSKEESELIRHLVALRFAGYTQREAFKEADINPNTAVTIMRRSEEAVEEAKQELVQRCLNEYHTNLWMLRSALSEMGSRAVRTLGQVMDDKHEKGFNRMKAAVAILKLIDIKGDASTGKAGDVPAEFLVTLKDARTGIETEAVHIVDAEYEEGTDEDTDECASGVC